MGLVGVRFTTRNGDDDEERTIAEFHLDHDNPNLAIAVSGHKTSLVGMALDEGVHSDPHLAVKYGEKYGVPMPLESHRFTVQDGVKFHIALMSNYKGNAYGGTYPIEG